MQSFLLEELVTSSKDEAGTSASFRRHPTAPFRPSSPSSSALLVSVVPCGSITLSDSEKPVLKVRTLKHPSQADERVFLAPDASVLVGDTGGAAQLGCVSGAGGVMEKPLDPQPLGFRISFNAFLS